MTNRMVGSVLTLVTLLFTGEDAAAQTYTQMQWGMNKGVTPYQFGANVNGSWSNLGTVSPSGVWSIPASNISGDISVTNVTAQNIYSPSVSIFAYLTSAQRANVLSGAATIDVSAALNTALNTCPSSGQSQQLYFPPGVYGVSSELIAQTCPVQIRLDQNATIKQIGSFGGTSAVEQKAIINFKAGAAGSELTGGVIDGNRAALVSDYIALPRATGSLGGYVIAAMWECVLVGSAANNIAIHDIEIKNCMVSPIWHYNASNVRISNVYAHDSSLAGYSQGGTNIRWENYTAKDISNKTGSTAIPVWAYAFVFTDQTNVSYSRISLQNYAPLFCDTGTLINNSTCSGGTHIGDPIGGAFIIMRLSGGTISDLSANGYSYDDPRGSPVAWGFQCDTCSNVGISNLQIKDYWNGAYIYSPTSVTLNGFSLDANWNGVFSSFAGAGQGTGLLVGSGGHGIWTANNLEDFYLMQSAKNFVASNGTVTRFFRGASIQTSNVAVSNAKFNSNQYWGVQTWSEVGNSSFPGSAAPQLTNLAFSNVEASFNGGHGFVFNHGQYVNCTGCVARDNGQLSTTTGASIGLNVNSGFGGLKKYVQFSDWMAIDDQNFTNTADLSFVPGTAVNNTFTLLAGSGNYSNNQSIVCKNCGVGPSDITVRITNIRNDLMTVSTSGNPTFSDSACTTALTGTVSGSANSTNLTGSGTAFVSEITKPAYLKVGGVYHRVVIVRSNTLLILDTKLPATISGASATLVQCDAEGIPSQTVGLSAKNAPAYVSDVNIGDPAQYIATGNITSQVDFAPGSAVDDWTSYTPTVTFSGGTSPVAAAKSGSYRIDGKTMCLNVNANVTYTAAPGQVVFTLPTDASGNQIYVGAMSALTGMNATTYQLLSAQVDNGASNFALVPAPGNSLFTASGQWVGASGCIKIQ